MLYINLYTKKRNMRILFLLTAITFFFHANAQDTKSDKFGKADLSSYNIENETNDPAVVLFKNGDIIFEFLGNRPVIRTTVHTRIKVFNDKGLKYGNVEIPIYIGTSNGEQVDGFKAEVYNLENGELVKSTTKYEKFTEELDDYRTVVKYTLPNVKIGSLIEYKYEIVSDYFWQIDRWYFQQEIPVKYSNLSLTIPQYITFNYNVLGYFAFQPNDYEKKYTTVGNLYSWTLRDLPAFVDEEYSKPSINYISSIDFELETITISYKTTKYTQTWEDVCSKLMENSSFGLQINKSFLSDEVIEVFKPTDTPLQKMEQIFNEVKTFAWNGKQSKYTSQTIRKTYKDKVGNSADLNLLLVNMLQLAELEAYPVLVSTRAHGEAQSFYPSSDNFNYVLVAVEIDGKRYFLDATSKYNEVNVLPSKLLNGSGRLVKSKTESQWVDITPEKLSKSIAAYELNLNDDLSMDGTISHKYTGNYALSNRQYYNSFSNNEDYLKALQESYESITFKSTSVENLEDVNESYQNEWSIEIKDAVEDLDGLVMLTPLLLTNWDENPFSLETRKYPLNFVYPFEQTFISNIKIPEGYTIDEVPESINISSPDKSCSFLYNMQSNGNSINVMARLKIKKADYSTTEYKNLREFFNHVAEKISAPIILTK